MEAFGFVSRLVYAKVVASMKNQCEEVLGQLIT
jgi:hypothetical protein